MLSIKIITVTQKTFTLFPFPTMMLTAKRVVLQLESQTPKCIVEKYRSFSDDADDDGIISYSIMPHRKPA